MEPVETGHGLWPNEKGRSLDISRTSTAHHAPQLEELPFFGPADPYRWPVHKTIFLVGALFPPLWYVGAFLPLRDDDDTWADLFKMRCQAAAMIVTIIAVALVVLLTAFDSAV